MSPKKKNKERVPDKISEDIKSSLKAIGLTEYEVNLYITLIASGPLNARDLADKSGVPYSRIYNILQMLEEKEFILKEEESRPSRYFAKSPDEALVIARTRNQQEFNEHAEKIVSELGPIYQSKDTPIKIALYVLRGKETCQNRVKAIMKSTQESFYLATSDITILREFYDDINALRARGIRKIRILTEESKIQKAENQDLLENYLEIAEVKTRDQLFGTGVVRDDGSDAFVLLTRSFFAKTSYFGIITDHIAFGPAAADYFGYLYETADLVEQ